MCLNPIALKNRPIYVDCGKCIECCVKKSNAWAFRVMLESRLYMSNCMITLTYNEDNLPEGSSLSRRDLQLFLKRLRKKVGKLRYFGCGEYGTRKGRPHYHLIIFGWCPQDLKFFCKDNKGSRLYRSKVLEECWTKGFSSVGELTFDSAKYCAIYMQKKPKDGRLKPFLAMSRRPGLAHDALNKDWLLTDKVYCNGKYITIPRYFIDKFENDFGLDLTDFKAKRELKCKMITDKILCNTNFLFEERMRRMKKYENYFRKSLDNDMMV